MRSTWMPFSTTCSQTWMSPFNSLCCLYGSPVAELYYTTLFEPMPEGGFNVLVPGIPEICTYGETLGDGREMARDAFAATRKAL
jgi:hypothetical protein